jgi:hypothetical protein
MRADEGRFESEKAHRYDMESNHRAWLENCSAVDTSSVILQHATIGSDTPGRSLLVTLVSVGNSQVIVNPVYAMIASISSPLVGFARSPCKHDTKTDQDELPLVHGQDLQGSCLWSLEDLLVNWRATRSRDRDEIFFSTRLDSELKVNIALSRCARGAVLTERCLQCAIEEVKAELARPISRSQQRDPRIIQRCVDKFAVALR